MIADNDHFQMIRSAVTRDLVTLGGMPETVATDIAEVAAVSVIELYARTQQYFNSATLTRVRNQKMREMHRRALANVGELIDMTGLSKKMVHKILKSKVNGAVRSGVKND